jgi:hypothetical protein
VPVMKVPTTGGNISTGKTLAVTISGTTIHKVFTVVTVTGVMAVAITAGVVIAPEAVMEAEVTVVAAGVTTKQALVSFPRAQGNTPTPTGGPGIAAKHSRSTLK